LVVVTAARGRFVLALATVLAAVTCGTASPPPPPPPALLLPVVEEHTLPSGLRVVIERDDRAAIAGVVLTVDVGSVDDPPGQHGMAHTLEHLAFRAPDAGGRSMRARLVKRGAATFNGATGIERTTYWAFGPRHGLDEMLAIFLGRLADPLAGVDDALFAKEASIVAAELRRREGSSGLEVLMPVLLPPGHPHARAWDERAQAPPLSLAEMRAFAARFHRPERMTLLISGPAPADGRKDLETKLPPAWIGRATEPRPPLRRPEGAAPPPHPLPASRGEGTGPTGLSTRETPAVRGPELLIGWRVPPASGLAARRLEVIARTLDRVLSGRLDPDGANDVLDVAAFAVPGRLASAVVCRFRLRSPDDAARIRDETTTAIEATRLRSGHETAVTEAILRTALGMESLKERTKAQAALVHYEAGAHTGRVLDALGKISADEVASFAGRYLTADAARAVLLVPAGTRSVTHARTQWTAETQGPDDATTAEPEPEPEPEPESDQDGAPAAAGPAPDPDLQAIVQAPGARAALVRQLSNGLSAIVLRRTGAPFVSLLLGFHADPQPGDPPGARIVFDRALNVRVSPQPLARGVLRAAHQRADGVQESLITFSGNLDQALDLLSHLGPSPHVRWPNPALARWADREAMRAAAPDGQSVRAFHAALFGDHAYGARPTAEAVRALTDRAARAWLARVRRPANGVLVIVGDVDPESAAQAADRRLRDWTGDVTAPPPPPPPLAPDRGAAATGSGVHGVQVLYTIDARRESSVVRFGCVVPPVRTPRDRIVHQLLAGLIKTNVFTRLRLGKGVTYGYDVDAESFRGGTAIIRGHIDVTGSATPDALDVLRDWFDPARASPITARRFQQQRWNRARRSGLLNATGPQMARSLFDAWNMGWEPAVLDDYPRDLASVTMNDVAAALGACRQSAVISVLGPDARPR
jgi:zinc protease